MSTQIAQPTPGMLHVTMQPKPTLLPAQFHDWYNNEHGPGRLRYPFCLNGFRYRATDLPTPPPSEVQAYGAKDSSSGTKEQPEWLAIYDITDMSEMLKEPYINLRKAPLQSQRERDTMKEINVDRRFYDLLPAKTKQADAFVDLQKPEFEGRGNAMVMVKVYLQEGEAAEEKFWKWYDETDLPVLMGMEGWLRSRAYKSATVDERTGEIMLLHEFTPSPSFTKDSFLSQTASLWDALRDIIKSKGLRTYNLWYTFGPAPRELLALSDAKYSIDMTLTDNVTKTVAATPGARASVESYITTPDGIKISYKLEGSSDPRAPLILLTNSILVTYDIWTPFISAFLSRPGGEKFRFLRYNSRGRTSDAGSKPITLDVLSADQIALLDALRVPRAAAIMGVSLGGATTLNTRLKYPERVAAAVVCDTSSKAPAGNAKAWGERIATSEKEAATSDGEGIVGGELAEITTKRWFVKESYDGADMEKRCWEVNEMVKANSREGFKKSVEALWEYDLEGLMDETKSSKTLFLVGAQDGVLPKTMKAMHEKLDGSQYVTIEGAGHLPMVEKPVEVAEAVSAFLA